MTNTRTIQQRLQDLLNTSPNLTLDEISAVNAACELIEELTVDHAAAQEAVINNCARVMTVTAERDALQAKLDISRRKLTELSKAEALENLYQFAMGQEREIVKLEKERDDFAYRYDTASNLTTSALDALSKALTDRDALMDSARLALGALMKSAVYLFDIETDYSVATVESINDAIEALKKAGVTP